MLEIVPSSREVRRFSIQNSAKVEKNTLEEHSENLKRNVLSLLFQLKRPLRTSLANMICSLPRVSLSPVLSVQISPKIAVGETGGVIRNLRKGFPYCAVCTSFANVQGTQLRVRYV